MQERHLIIWILSLHPIVAVAAVGCQLEQPVAGMAVRQQAAPVCRTGALDGYSDKLCFCLALRRDELLFPAATAAGAVFPRLKGNTGPIRCHFKEISAGRRAGELHSMLGVRGEYGQVPGPQDLCAWTAEPGDGTVDGSAAVTTLSQCCIHVREPDEAATSRHLSTPQSEERLCCTILSHRRHGPASTHPSYVHRRLQAFRLCSYCSATHSTRVAGWLRPYTLWLCRSLRASRV